jgi:hypothetical protein
MIGLTDKRYSLAFAVVLFAATCADAQQAYDPMSAARGMQPSAQENTETVATDPDFEDLPNTAGMEDTYYQCVACHSTAIIKQQHLTDARWDYLWGWMVKEQGMQEADAETKEVILTYLKTHFSSER